MNFEINGIISAFVFNETKDGIYITNCNGFVMEAEQMIEIANKMIKFANKNKLLLEDYNKKRQMKFENELNNYKNTSKEKKYQGYVYFIKCGDRYKIGYTKDVKKRMKQLDFRPYKIEIITYSKLLSKAYLIEQELHNKFKNKNVIGEWYDFTKEQIDEIKGYINSLSENSGD